MRIIVAIPTIKERGTSWQDMAESWYSNTPPEHDIICVPSWKKPTWAAGLNEVWEIHPEPDVMVCGSDDMHPEDDQWLSAIEPYLHLGIIAPQVYDPRFVRFDATVKDGDETRMSSFPIIPSQALSSVFPLPDELHYYSDDLISDKAREAGISTIAVPSCKIRHLFDDRARGAGMGDESTRMAHDRAIYKTLRRKSLPLRD